MARVTVEDCVDKVPNRFDLVMLAAHRARELSEGAPATIERENDKNPVISLREIAEETQAVDPLRERAIKLHQTQLAEEDLPEDVPHVVVRDGTPDIPEDSPDETEILRQLMGVQPPSAR